MSLPEVLVAIAVAAVALASCPLVLGIIGRAAIVARDGSAAVALAQAKLEELATGPAAPTAGGDAPATVGAPTTLARTWEVEAVDPRAEVRRISVAVVWGGAAHRVALETLVWRP
jgi:Tfp pilus assembly protein PilV